MRFFMKAIMLVFAFSFCAAGCVSYYKPTSSDVATISISHSWGHNNSEIIYVYKIDELTKMNCLHYSGVSRLATINNGNPLAPRTSNLEDIPIAAGQPIRLRIYMIPAANVGTLNTSQNCIGDLFFTPKKDVGYELSLKTPPCEMSIKENGMNLNLEVKAVLCN
jgi:hypothetical protein